MNFLKQVARVAKGGVELTKRDQIELQREILCLILLFIRSLPVSGSNIITLSNC